MTIRALIKLDSLASTQIIYAESINGGAGSRIALNVTTDGELRLAGRSNDSDSFTVFAISDVTAIGTGTWYDVSGVYDFGGTNNVFIDAVEATDAREAASATFDGTASQDIFIGHVTTVYTTGNIASLQVYERALALSELRLLNNRTRR